MLYVGNLAYTGYISNSDYFVYLGNIGYIDYIGNWVTELTMIYSRDFEILTPVLELNPSTPITHYLNITIH